MQAYAGMSGELIAGSLGSEISAIKLNSQLSIRGTGIMQC
jgi:hypothetical protein